MTLKETLKQTPFVGPRAYAMGRAARRLLLRFTKFRSPDYWEARYARGGNSGSGSYGQLAEFKAAVLNDFVARHEISSVIEFGCGDGHQLSLSKYPSYVGIDVSATAVERCRKVFQHDRSKKFLLAHESSVDSERADLVLSLDVIYHLVEDDVYDRYMRSLFGAANQFVVIYSDNEESPDEAQHVRHRRFTNWIELNKPDWKMIEHIPNQFPRLSNNDLGSWADFWVFINANSDPTSAV
jgi:hypothetical protein